MQSFDCETTGLDHWHGALPFFVTMCDELGDVKFWEWDVDPLTREPLVPAEDLSEIIGMLSDEDVTWVLQNGKFDARAIEQLCLKHGKKVEWPWKRLRDTLIAGHLLASNQPHDLTTMALIYLDVNIKPVEDAIEEAVKEGRRLVRTAEFKSKYGKWRIADKDLPEMPSAKEETWRFDYWLPRAIAKAEEYLPDHPWWTVLRDYSNMDSSVTLPLYQRQEELIKQQNLWEIYAERLRLLPIIHKIEGIGVTIQGDRLHEIRDEYVSESAKADVICVNLAKSYDFELSLPKSGNNKSLTSFVFDVLKLPALQRSPKTGAPSLNKTVIEQYQATLPECSRELKFVNTLSGKRKRDTSIGYMDGYARYWQPRVCAQLDNPATGAGWYVLHPSLNLTGTGTLRWSSSNPNEQNISRKDTCAYCFGVGKNCEKCNGTGRQKNLRYAFGPAPGREWWSCDAQNLELRIPAYEAGETEMVNLFNNPNESPYFGSYHMLIFDTLHPEKFAKHGMACKEIFESTWYSWTKNGNFAVQYGAQEYSGTADRAYHVPGAQARIKSRFTEIGKLSDRMIAYAKKYGYVETIPDKSIGAKRGYPLLCTRTKYGEILPTVPLSYHIQSAAMWWMARAMVRCQDYLDAMTRRDSRGYHIVLQVHDELVFDFPAGKGPEPWRTNGPKVKHIMGLMAQGGDDIGVVTPVSAKWHPVTWADGKKVVI